MSFFDNLKKPYTPPKAPQKPVITTENMLAIAKNIAEMFKQNCLECRKNGFGYAVDHYTWVKEGEYYSASEVSRSMTAELVVDPKFDMSALRHMSYDECRKICLLVNGSLKPDGFPYDTAKVVELGVRNRYAHKPMGYVYCLKLEAYWG